MSEESKIGDAVQLAVTEEGGRIFRNQVGLFYTITGTPVKIGSPGMPDYIGWIPVTITADMVGQTIAQFLGIETKSVDAKTQKDRLKKQKNFINVVRRSGGRAFMTKDPQHTKEELRKIQINNQELLDLLDTKG